jgi:hypothetical protein
MRYFATFLVIPLLTATTLAGCGSSDQPTDLPTTPTPVVVTETFNGSLNVNGAQNHSFGVERAGTVQAQIKTLSDQAATIGVSLGTWNGVACTVIIRNTAAVLNTTITGTAQQTGQYCVSLNDVGKLTAGVDYSVEVTHY